MIEEKNKQKWEKLSADFLSEFLNWTQITWVIHRIHMQQIQIPEDWVSVMAFNTVAKDIAYTQEHNHLFTPACLWSLWVIMLFMFPLCKSDFTAPVIFYTKTHKEIVPNSVCQWPSLCLWKVIIMLIIVLILVKIVISKSKSMTTQLQDQCETKEMSNSCWVLSINAEDSIKST